MITHDWAPGKKIDPALRFWCKVNKFGKQTSRVRTRCWEWTGAKQAGGYGRFWDGEKRVLAHVWSWTTLLCMSVPPSKELDHRCHNPSCVRPSHLEPVTHQVNILRGNPTGHNRHKTRCHNGHRFSLANTRRTRCGRRQCRQCERDRKVAARKRL